MTWDLAALFRMHATDIAKALRRRGFNEETAADLTQDTFLRILISPPREAHGRHNPAAYLFRVARNLGIDQQRRDRLFVRTELSLNELAAIPDASPSPEVATYDRQRLDLTRAALAELPARTRAAFEMHRIDDLTISEVAAELGLSISRTWSLIRDAYEHIDTRLASQ